MKTCRHCNQQFELSAFPRVKNGRGVLYTRNICKTCWNARHKVWMQDARTAEPRMHRISTVDSQRPCDACYRLERCKTEAFECAAFQQWVSEGQFTPAFVGMRERVVAPALSLALSAAEAGVEV